MGAPGGGIYVTRQSLYCNTTTTETSGAAVNTICAEHRVMGPCMKPIEAACDDAKDLFVVGGCKNPTTSDLPLLAISRSHAGDATKPARHVCAFTDETNCFGADGCGSGSTYLGAAAIICCLTNH